MASGLLGNIAPAANTLSNLYVVPASTLTSCTVNAVNTGTNAASVRIALSSSGTPDISEYIEYGAPLLVQGDLLERTGLVINASKNIVVWANTSSVSFTVYGFEETIV